MCCITDVYKRQLLLLAAGNGKLPLLRDNGEIVIFPFAELFVVGEMCIRDRGKYISFRAAGQERFTRTKTLGAAYTEEAIKERIKGVYVAKTKTLREDKKIRLVVDLENRYQDLQY